MTSEYKKAVEKVGDADGDWWEWHEYLFDSSGSWSEIMEDPLSFLPRQHWATFVKQGMHHEAGEGALG